LLGACGNQRVSDEAVALVTATPTAAAPTPGDEGPATAAPTNLSALITAVPPDTPVPLCTATASTTQVDDRAVLVRQPTASAPVPIVIAIHGFKGTPEGLELHSELTSALASSAIVAYPSGSPLDLGFGWNSGAGRFATDSPDDVAVIVAMIDRLAGMACADPARVYLVGESNGGGMAVRAACDQRTHGRLAGVVVVNAAVDDGVLGTCAQDATPVPLIATAGLRDGIVPYDGSREPFLPVESWFTTLAGRISGCRSSGVDRTPWSEGVELIAATDCGTCAHLYTVADGAHVWPGSTSAGTATPGSFGVTALLADMITGRRDGCGAAAAG
jgi:polyhydroxybutyrate depolymerase